MSDIVNDQPDCGVLMVTGPLPRLVRKFMDRAKAVRYGSLTINLPSGTSIRLQGTQPGPNAQMDIKRTRLARRFFLGGHLGFSEAYLDEDWESPDVTALLRYFLLNEPFVALEPSRIVNFIQRTLHRLRRHNRKHARRNVRDHYDLGNAFYKQWLDPSMTYSSALFEPGDADLESAQLSKNRRIAEMAGIKAGDRVLEIGCGWGGFACYAASLGASVVGITLSEEQFRLARERVAAAGYEDRVEIRLQDYRDVEGRFDKVISIEMIEAVGEKYWSSYFAKIHEVLVPGGQAAIQAILIEDARYDTYRSSADFIQRHVFPGGMLPAPSVLLTEVKRAGLNWVADHGFAEDYARTLKIWRERFLTAWPTIRPLGFDERFRRLWSYYLSYCEAGFLSDSIDVRQILIARA